MWIMGDGGGRPKKNWIMGDGGGRSKPKDIVKTDKKSMRDSIKKQLSNENRDFSTQK